MYKKGYTVKEGKHLAFKHHKYKRFVRGKTLGVDYTRDSINTRIDMKNMGIETINFSAGNENYTSSSKTFFSLFN